MKKYGIPTADYQVFDDPAKALDYLRTASFPIVVKADGLALGKGVVIAQNEEEPRPPCTPSWRTRFSVKAAPTW